MTLPKSISPCPIIEAVFEVRFSSELPRNAVFGIVYNSLKSKFRSNPITLPILQIPENVRENDPNLKFKPHYKLEKENLIVQIGPDVLTISIVSPYNGWEIFSNEIHATLQSFIETDVVSSFSRVGLRYVNFFSSPIFEKMNINVSLNENEIEYHNTLLRTSFFSGEFTSNLAVSNNSSWNQKIGAIIDIDTFITGEAIQSFESERKNLLDKAHDIEKNLFFSLLKPDFLKSLNPIYS